ncbi:uncharacterized protein LOC144923905 isoform X2 [Branchiostoma floridae x Branchiostoma belcheri]
MNQPVIGNWTYISGPLSRPSLAPIIQSTQPRVDGHTQGKTQLVVHVNSNRQRNMADKFSIDELAKIKGVFNKFDSDGSGAINITELEATLAELGENPSEDTVTALMLSLDKDRSGTLSFEEFLGMVKQVKTVPREDALLTIFKTYDKDGSGQLGPEELKEAMKARGCELSDRTIDYLINKVDKDADGKLTYEEFVKLIRPRS